MFTEFAFTLAGAVTVSAVIALTLSPMMCSRLLHAQKADQNNWEARIIRFIDERFQWLHDGYQRLLQRSLRYTPVTAVFVVVIMVSIFLLYRSAKSELAPTEDQSFVLAQATYAPDATLQQKLLFGSQAFSLVNSQPGVATVFQIDAPGQSITGVPLVPPNQRKFSAIEFQRSLQTRVEHAAGTKIRRVSAALPAGSARAAGAIRDRVHRAGAAAQ